MPGLNKPRREGGYTAYEIAWAKKRYTEQLAIQEAEDDAILKKKLDAENRKLREQKLMEDMRVRRAEAFRKTDQIPKPNMSDEAEHIATRVGNGTTSSGGINGSNGVDNSRGGGSALGKSNWTCKHCNNVNYAFRTICNRHYCNMPRDSEAEVVGQGGSQGHFGKGCGADSTLQGNGGYGYAGKWGDGGYRGNWGNGENNGQSGKRGHFGKGGEATLQSDGAMAMSGNGQPDTKANGFGVEKNDCADPEDESWKGVTTVIMRRISRKYTVDLFEEELVTSGFGSSIRYLHLPWDIHKGHNVGYGFVDLYTEQDALAFRNYFHNKDMQLFQGANKVKVHPATLQGGCGYKWKPIGKPLPPEHSHANRKPLPPEHSHAHGDGDGDGDGDEEGGGGALNHGNGWSHSNGHGNGNGWSHSNGHGERGGSSVSNGGNGIPNGKNYNETNGGGGKCQAEAPCRSSAVDKTNLHINHDDTGRICQAEEEGYWSEDY
jgi:hypothetical protein